LGWYYYHSLALCTAGYFDYFREVKTIYRFFICTLFIILLKPASCAAYSILSHQAVIDAAWTSSILPLLKKNYPVSTDEEWKEAHAYAYGGSVAADMGYFPFGSALFSDLVHYVRSGDFIETLIKEAKDMNEYAFSLGFLSHYHGDQYGHSIATNISAPLLYPKIKKKYGAMVTYEEDPTSHARTEFGFDVLQLARGTYEPQAYRDFIGFQISRSLLERAFIKTYGINLNDVFGSFALAVGTFRWSVKSLIPTLTKAAWKTKKNEIQKLRPGITSRQFKYKMNRKTYFQEYGKERQKPGLGPSLLSFALKVLPKIGPLKKLRFVVPGPMVEKLFIKSFDTVSYQYGGDIQKARNQTLMLRNIDFDTGNPTVAGEYGLADKTYVTLLLKLKEQNFDSVTLPLKHNLVSFFNNPQWIHKKNSGDTQKLVSALEALKKLNLPKNKNPAN
jgi:hypothetical protein